MEAMTQMMQGGAPSPDGGTPGGAKPPEAGPAGSPAASPMQPKGNQEVAKVKVQHASKLLKEVIGSFEYDSEPWKAVDKALSALSKSFPAQETSSINNAQMVNLMTKQGG